MSFLRCYKVVTTVAIILLVFLRADSSAQILRVDFYDKTCPKLIRIVQEVIRAEISKDPRMGASLVRLHFHDCFVNGCDGSILLDGKSGEKNANANINSARGFEVIDRIKNNVVSCRDTVSCADILALAARESVLQLQGPRWALPLGRRDSRTSSQVAANNNLPSPSMNLKDLLRIFNNVGLDATDLVALSGAHTIGKAHCTNFMNRIYNETDIDRTFAKSAQKTCPKSSGNVNVLEPLDFVTPTVFDNSYYKNLMARKGLLHSDQILFSGGLGALLVEQYSKYPNTFFNAFATAMVKMGNIRPPNGEKTEIRKKCSKRN